MENVPAPIRWIMSLIGGSLIGAVGTPLSQASFSAGDVSVPWGLIVALIVVAAYLGGLRLVSSGRWLALWGAIGILVTVFLMSLEGPGGGVLVPANLAGTVWAIAPAVIAVVAVAFPSLAARR